MFYNQLYPLFRKNKYKVVQVQLVHVVQVLHQNQHQHQRQRQPEDGEDARG